MLRFVALLRAVNVGGRKVPMAELRTLCGAVGWTDVATYIQSGNVVFSAQGEPQALEAQLEKALAERFGFAVDVVIRSAAQWRAHAAANPFLEASEERPNLVMLLVSKAPPVAGAAAALQARAADGERVTEAGNALWIDYPAGSGRSKLTPTLIDRAIGSAATSRNWRTVQTLCGMLAE
jgi:uncharacterized protein (DUF1697 family)